jgi:glycerate kinase
MLDKEGKQVSFGAKGLKEIVTITDDQVIPELKECSFRVACDVTNPLCGELGCSAVFGPQKGADKEMIKQMDEWLSEYAALTSAKYEKADVAYPGTGAAGGLGFAFLAYTDAVLESGIKIILEETNLEDYVKDADVVVTGEGRLDGQTVFGKAPIGVAKLAKKYNKTVLAFAGAVSEDACVCNTHGIDAFFSILRSVQTLEEAMDGENAAKNMEATAEQVFRLVKR